MTILDAVFLFLQW